MHAYQPHDPDVGSRGEEMGSSTVRITPRVPTIKDNCVCWPSCGGLRRELLRAELAGELSEFHALCFQAILAMIEGAECADDYLEMAEAVAVGERELALVAGIRTTRDLVQRTIVPGHLQASSGQAAKQWQSLLVALTNLASQPNAIRQKK